MVKLVIVGIDASESQQTQPCLSGRRRREEKPQHQVNDALVAGYRFLKLTTIGGYIFVLERKVEGN